jgi:hypothetical protein
MRAANVCFGARYRNRLFMAASHSIYSLYVNRRAWPAGDSNSPAETVSGSLPASAK